MTKPEVTEELEPLNGVTIEAENALAEPETTNKRSSRRHSSSRRRSGNIHNY